MRRAVAIARCLCIHTVEDYLDAYVRAAAIAEDKKGWLFRAAPGKTGQLSERPLLRRNALEIIKGRAR